MNGHALVWPVVVFMAICGIATHWLKQLAMMRKESTPGMGTITARTYWVTYWPESLAAITSTAAGITLLAELNMLTHALAFGVGYMGNSMADMIGGRVQAMITAAPPPVPQVGQRGQPGGPP